VAEMIRVAGLREFRRSLRKLDSSLPKGLRLAGNTAAGIVVQAAKPRVPTGPGKGGHAKTSLRAASTSSAARVAFGGKRFPYAPWLDFGGRVGRRHQTQRPFLKEGRYVWKAYGDNKGKVQKVLRSELSDLARAAGLGGL
jgi:hypothetical protein